MVAELLATRAVPTSLKAEAEAKSESAQQRAEEEAQLTYERSDLEPSLVEELLHRERCDVRVHEAATALVTQRMAAMPQSYAKRWPAFERRMGGGSVRRSAGDEW